MRKFVSLMFIVSMLFLTLMAGIIDEAIKNSEIVQNKIKELNLYWSAGGNIEFFKKFEKFNPTFDEVLKKLCGTRVLPEDYKGKLFNYLRMLSNGMRGMQPFGMTTTDDLIMGSLVLAKPESVLDSYFYRLEPVRDQMFHGSCWAFSTIGSFESAYAIQVLNKDEGNVDNELDFSERWVAYHNIDWDIYTFSLYELIQDKNSLEGGNPYFAMFNATRYGEIKEEYAPYSEVFLTADEVIPLPAQAFGAPRYKSSKTLIIPSAPDAKALGYGYDEYISMIKSAIKNYGSLSVVYYVLNDFASYTHGVYTPTTDIIAGAHAVTLVGWASLEDLDDIVLSEKTNPDATPVLDTEPSTFVYYDPTRGKTYTADLFWIVKNS
ncbi:MAG: peptidase C1, partial [Thermotoga sp.]